MNTSMFTYVCLAINGVNNSRLDCRNTCDYLAAGSLPMQLITNDIPAQEQSHHLFEVVRQLKFCQNKLMISGYQWLTS